MGTVAFNNLCNGAVAQSIGTTVITGDSTKRATRIDQLRVTNALTLARTLTVYVGEEGDATTLATNMTFNALNVPANTTYYLTSLMGLSLTGAGFIHCVSSVSNALFISGTGTTYSGSERNSVHAVNVANGTEVNGDIYTTSGEHAREVVTYCRLFNYSGSNLSTNLYLRNAGQAAGPAGYAVVSNQTINAGKGLDVKYLIGEGLEHPATLYGTVAGGSGQIGCFLTVSKFVR